MISNVVFLNLLREVVAVRFVSKSLSATGWNGSGSGVVEVSEPSTNSLEFRERGSWKMEGGKEMDFSNVFRWSLFENVIRLEHLRFGHNTPVFLFDMAADETGVWHEVTPHPCQNDCYRASLRVVNRQIFVGWRVNGASKSEVIDYTYDLASANV